MENAPKDRLILLYGHLDPHEDNKELYSRLDKPTRVTGYWDEIDQAWCPMGATWLGPWFKPILWTEVPEPPVVD